MPVKNVAQRLMRRGKHAKRDVSKPHVKGYTLRITSQEWQVDTDKSRVISQKWQDKTDKTRVTRQDWQDKSYNSRVTCQKPVRLSSNLCDIFFQTSFDECDIYVIFPAGLYYSGEWRPTVLGIFELIRNSLLARMHAYMAPERGRLH